MITYIRCPVCGKLSKVSNFHTRHEIPQIMTQEIKHPKGKKHFFLNIWNKLILSKSQRRTQLINLKGILERRLQRINDMLELLDIELRMKPKTYMTQKPMITWTQKPSRSLEVNPTVEMVVKV